MRRSEKNRVSLEEMRESFLPAPEVEEANLATVELRERLVKVEQQVLAQYTATAAYATIAKQSVESCRAEARSDLDRSQSTLIGLVEKLRAEMQARAHGAQAAAASEHAAPGADALARLAAMEDRLDSVSAALERVTRENDSLRVQLAAVLEERMRADGWLASSGTAAELSLR